MIGRRAGARFIGQRADGLRAAGILPAREHFDGPSGRTRLRPVGQPFELNLSNPSMNDLTESAIRWGEARGILDANMPIARKVRWAQKGGQP